MKNELDWQHHFTQNTREKLVSIFSLRGLKLDKNFRWRRRSRKSVGQKFRPRHFKNGELKILAISGETVSWGTKETEGSGLEVLREVSNPKVDLMKGFSNPHGPSACPDQNNNERHDRESESDPKKGQSHAKDDFGQEWIGWTKTKAGRWSDQEGTTLLLLPPGEFTPSQFVQTVQNLEKRNKNLKTNSTIVKNNEKT